MTRRIRAPILVFSGANAAIASGPSVAYWVLSQLALCSPKYREKASARSSARMRLSGPRSKRMRRFRSGCGKAA
jgi:hypothetical protein